MWHFMHTHTCSQHKRAIHVLEKIHLTEIICMGKVLSKHHKLLFVGLWKKTNPPLPHPPILSTEIKEFFSRLLFTFKCLSLHLWSEQIHFREKKVRLVSLMIKWFFGLAYFVLSINNVTLLIWNILIQYRFLFLQFFFTHIVLVQSNLLSWRLRALFKMKFLLPSMKGSGLGVHHASFWGTLQSEQLSGWMVKPNFFTSIFWYKCSHCQSLQ